MIEMYVNCSMCVHSGVCKYEPNIKDAARVLEATQLDGVNLSVDCASYEFNKKLNSLDGEELEVEIPDFCYEGGVLLNIYKVSRTDCISWCEDYEIIVAAEDEKRAEYYARINSNDFKKARDLSIEKVDISKGGVIAKLNTGA